MKVHTPWQAKGLRRFKTRSWEDPGVVGKFLVLNMADVSRNISQKNLICDSFFTENYNKLFKLRALFESRGESDITNYLSVSLQSPVFMSHTFNVLSYEPLTTFSSSTWIKKCTQTCKMTIENDNWGTHCSSCVLRVLWKLPPNLSTGKKARWLKWLARLA